MMRLLLNILLLADAGVSSRFVDKRPPMRKLEDEVEVGMINRAQEASGSGRPGEGSGDRQVGDLCTMYSQPISLA